jgi:hypothetical protein
MAKSVKSHANQSISFPPKLLAESKARAKSLGLSFSAFVRKCLERDLADRPEAILKEQGDAAQIAAAPPPPPQGVARPRKARK